MCRKRRKEHPTDLRSIPQDKGNSSRGCYDDGLLKCRTKWNGIHLIGNDRDGRIQQSSDNRNPRKSICDASVIRIMESRTRFSVSLSLDADLHALNEYRVDRMETGLERGSRS